MSDEEENSSSDDDFSASEDEWKPKKSNNRQDSDDESDDDDSDFEAHGPNYKRREAKSHHGTLSKSDSAAKQTKKRKSTGTSLRTKLFNKYKPPPKTLRNQPTPVKSVKEKRASGAHTSKNVSHSNKNPNSSDSDSSGDDYLVNPDEIDLQSSFFDVKPSTSGDAAAATSSLANTGPPQFECNAGMQLSDSDEDIDDDEDDDETESIRNATKASTTKPVDLGYLQDFAANIENAKVQYKKHKERSQLVVESKVDVSSLLAMGEGNSSKVTSTASTKKTKNPKRQSKKTQPSQTAADSDSDWEEVEADEDFSSAAQLPDALANGIQVSIDLPQRHRKDKKAIDVEATLKRQLNRIIKENQIYLHKVSLLCHISNGLFLNKVANNINLMPIALKLLPSRNAYPSGQTEIKYFQSMVTWFKTAVKIHDDRTYPSIKVDPVLSLAVQMKNCHAVCKRDFILIFVILLRAMGLQCRLVVNMVPMSLRPEQSVLCSLKMKPTDGDGKKVLKKEAIVKAPAKKDPIKSPPLSREEREELRMKVENLERDIAKKKRGKLKPKPSFEEELEAKVAPPSKVVEKKAEPVSVKDAHKSTTKPKEMTATKNELKRKTLDNSNEPVKKKKVETVTKPAKLISKKESVSKKSPYFPDSSQNTEQKNLVASLESHSKSFEDQQPSISVTSKQTKGQPTRNTCSRADTATKPKLARKVTPAIVIVADDKQNLENKPRRTTRVAQSRDKSPKTFISPAFLQTKASKALTPIHAGENSTQSKRSRSKSPDPSGSASVKTYISTEFLKSTTNRSTNATETKPSPRKLRSRAKLTVPQLDGADDLPKSRRKQHIKKPQTHNSDDDFQPSASKRPKVVDKLKKLDRRVLSPDTADDGQSPSRPKKKAINMWVEVYSELEEHWVCVDLFKGKVHCVDSIRKSVTPSTLAYVFAFNNDATMKDVTPRYCAQWATVVRKGRVEQSWLDEAIREYVTTHRTQRDLTEDMDLRRIHLDKPMPTTISEYKDHPLYALERHLLKFQAIYPPNALTLGFVRGEPVYARECIHTLHSREIWLKSARVVKPGEQPYKIVKARPKWDKFTSTVIKDQPLEIFGYWQTQDYEPPTAENGIVPRNAYGNVELFKECMLPKKTVHLHLPGLNRVCKKLGIDCVPAVVGFDFHQGSCHPLLDGFVVCEEFAEMAADAWDKEQQDIERKEQEKYEARVYGNWKKLIKGLLIRERLKIKYNF